ncbi:unnamed protein product [Paramecium pentaurelia]|uniref:WD-40 repeat protein n=1 Tax=Paramecium pentaurelia TaxID=43138 RepID=A0A8S1XTT5_9CILI|nr:unnamed protein product [Paramecium pentaurelia]
MQCSSQEKEDLSDILAQVKKWTQILIKEKVKGCIGYFSDNGNQKYLDSYDKQRKYLKQITEVLRKLKDHDFNNQDFFSEVNDESKLSLIQSKPIIEFLYFLVQLTSIDNTLIQCGSNSLYILVYMKVDLRNQCFENIRIKNTSIIRGNFVRCNFNGSEFDNLDISILNLNSAQMFDCKLKNIEIHELNKLEGHSGRVNTVCFSLEGNILASGSEDNSIRLWDIKTKQQKAKLDGHTNGIMSVCFSSDGNTLASGSFDNTIRLWDVKT